MQENKKYNQISEGQGLLLTQQSISLALSRCYLTVDLSSLELVRSVFTMRFLRKQLVSLTKTLRISPSFRLIPCLSFLYKVWMGWSSSISRRPCSTALPIYLRFFFLACLSISQKASILSSPESSFLRMWWLLDLLVRKEITWLTTFDYTFFLGYLKREALELDQDLFTSSSSFTLSELSLWALFGLSWLIFAIQGSEWQSWGKEGREAGQSEWEKGRGQKGCVQKQQQGAYIQNDYKIWNESYKLIALDMMSITLRFDFPLQFRLQLRRIRVLEGQAPVPIP